MTQILLKLREISYDFMNKIGSSRCNALEIQQNYLSIIVEWIYLKEEKEKKKLIEIRVMKLKKNRQEILNHFS